MEAWNKILHTAMMGTDKKTMGAAELSPVLAEAAGVIIQNTSLDKEEQLLQLAALTYNYRQCAVLPLQKENAVATAAPAEEKPYCSVEAMQLLKDILYEENEGLLQQWLTACASAHLIAAPEILPVLFTAYRQYKQLRSSIISCAGRRGEWLAGLNPDWNFSVTQSPQEVWNTGTPDQRRTMLTQLRNTDAAGARTLVEESWAQEDAATKVSFLEILSINISDADISFLQSLQNEKGKKVKEEALKLLKQIPASPIVQQYTALLQKGVSIKTEKTLLGMMSKTSVSFQLPADIEPEIFKSGIEKLSSDARAFTDEEFIFYQLIQAVPPSFWEQQLEKTPQQVIELLEKDATGKKMIPAILLSILQFKDQRWASAMLQYCSTFYIDLIPLLPPQQQEFYSNKFFKGHEESIIHYATRFNREWSKEMTSNILTHAAKNPYHFNRNFFSEHIQLIPSSIQKELDSFTAPEEYHRNSWEKTKEHLSRLLNLKQQITQSFTA